MREMEAGRPPEIKRSRKPARPVKRELNQEMKSFAESTMNELLGWYGYEEVDLREVSGAVNRKPCVKRHVSVLRENSVPSALTEGASLENEKHGQREGAHARAISVSSSSSSSTSSTTSSSGSEEKEPRATHVIVPLIKPSAVEEVQNVLIVCVWCQREGVRRFSLLMGRQLKSFCSEKCFFACRRAHFKRNKANDSSCHGDKSPVGKEEEDCHPIPKIKSNTNTKVCDWCKRMQPTHEYVATGTADERLHFCSSECVNQYKMDVFYREARAALTARQSAEDNTAEVKESKVKEGSPTSPLLTPASWTSALKPTHSPRPPHPASSSSSSSSSSAAASAAPSAAPTASEPIRVCHSSTSSSSCLPPLSVPNQERFTITRVTVPPPPPPPPQCPPLPPPPPPALIIRPRTPHTLPPCSPPLPSHTRSPSHTFAAAQTHSSLALARAHAAPPPLAPPILTPMFPGAPMMHLPPGCPPVMPHVPTHPHAPRLVLPVPSLPPPFPQNTLMVPYPIIIPLPVPVPIPLPLLLPAGALTPSHTRASPSAEAHTPHAQDDQGGVTHTGVCVKAESPSSPHTHANTHLQGAQAETEARSTDSDTEADGEKEREKENDDYDDEEDVEGEREAEDETEDDKKATVNGQREEWRETWRERKVIQSPTPIPPLDAEAEASTVSRGNEASGDRVGPQTSSTHTANSAPVLQRYTLSPRTHVIHVTHTTQTALTHTHTHTTPAVQGLADQKHPSQSPHITHTNSSLTKCLPTVPRAATCAVSQIVAVPTDSSHKLSPSPGSPESQSEDLKENCIRNGRCHELTDGQAHKSDGSRGAEEESEHTSEDEEHTDAQHTPAKCTNIHKRAHTQMQPHTQSLQRHEEEEPEEKRYCLNIRDQNV